MGFGRLYLKVSGNVDGVKSEIEKLKKKGTKNIIAVTKFADDPELDKVLSDSTEKSDIMVQFKFDDDTTLNTTTEKVSGVTGVSSFKRLVY
jgi:hypothetical protein